MFVCLFIYLESGWEGLEGGEREKFLLTVPERVEPRLRSEAALMTFRVLRMGFPCLLQSIGSHVWSDYEDMRRCLAS